MTAQQKLTVVVSRGQSRHPAKRQLEHDLAAALTRCEGVEVLVIPHLYDVQADGAAIRAIGKIEGDMVVAAWLYPRAIRWILDGCGVGDRRDRSIRCVDLRRCAELQPAADGLAQIAAAMGIELVDATDRTGDLSAPAQVDEETARRWYPVIDYDRCTNCMECIDFCLFGVYGLDRTDSILVEEPDACRKGCPACARVCPAGAIMFPQHELPEIAGADDSSPRPKKINLTKLLAGSAAPSPIDVAARERDEHLAAASGDGESAADPSRKRKEGEKRPPQDELDRLIDEVENEKGSGLFSRPEKES